MSNDDKIITLKPIDKTIELPELEISENFITGLNLRNWVRDCFEKSGAKFTGGSVGNDDVDLDIEIDGCKYLVKVYPQIRK